MRWAVLATVALLVVVLAVVVTAGSGPALYWAGQPIADKHAVLSQGEAVMSALVGDDEATLSPRARCYFSVTGRQGHDVGPQLYCGPVRLPWTAPADPWLSLGLVARTTSAQGQVTLALAAHQALATTVALPAGQQLRRPDGGSPPAKTELAAPDVPRQPRGWAAELTLPPRSLSAAPVGDVMVAWGSSYRLVAYGEVPYLEARSAPGALRVAYVPPGSRWGTGAGDRPVAPLVLPAPGQVFAVAELAPFPGEMSGPVASGAGSAQAPDAPLLQVAGSDGPVQVPSGKAADGPLLTVAAGVPEGSHPVLQVVDKGLTQAVSLADGALSGGPAVLTRTGTDTVLHASARSGTYRINLDAASLVWFAGSDGGTVPPGPADAYLEVLATTTPAAASLELSAADFSLRLPGGQVVNAVPLPVQDRQAAVVGFIVPASFGYGTVVVATGGRPLEVPVRFS